MSLDNTQRETLVFKSVKKFLVDNLHRDKGVTTLFGFPEESPKTKKEFVVVLLSDFSLGTASSSSLTFFFFTKKDNNGELSALYEKILDCFIDNTAIDGVMRIPFLDDAGNQFSAMRAYPLEPSSRNISIDRWFFRTMRVMLQWGGK